MPQLRLERGMQDEPGGVNLPVHLVGRPNGASAKLKPGPGRSPAEVSSHQRARIHRATVAIVSEQGYEAVTVRRLAGAASVSTRTFYQHCSGKEDCFLQVQQLLVRRVLGSLRASRIGVSDRKARISREVDAIVREWGRDPRAAHLVLVDSYSAGPMALKQMCRANCSIKAIMADDHADASEETAVPSPMVEGIVAGLISTVRSQVLSDRKQLLVDELSPGLTRWALSYCDPSATQLEKLDRANGLKPVAGIGETLTPMGDMGALISAAAKLAVGKEYGSITPRGILAAAGVPRRSFYENFSNTEDCLAAAIELYAGHAVAHAKGASEKGQTPAGGVYLAVLALCVQVAQNPVFAGLCFDENGAAGAAKVRCHRRLMTSVASLAEGVSGSDEIALEASAGALWGVLQSEVTMGRARKAPQLAGTLAYLMLAPVVGASAAVEAIGQECMPTEQRQPSAVETGRAR